MKRTILFVLILFSIVTSVRSQTQVLNGFFIIPTPLSSGRDSLNNPIHREDSLELRIFVAFNDYTTEIKQLNLLFGDAVDQSNVAEKIIKITHDINGSYIDGQQIPYGKVLQLNFRIVKNSDLKWATAFYLRNTEETSGRSYFKINR